MSIIAHTKNWIKNVDIDLKWLIWYKLQDLNDDWVKDFIWISKNWMNKTYSIRLYDNWNFKEIWKENWSSIKILKNWTWYPYIVIWYNKDTWVKTLLVNNKNKIVKLFEQKLKHKIYSINTVDYNWDWKKDLIVWWIINKNSQWVLQIFDG